MLKNIDNYIRDHQFVQMTSCITSGHSFMAKVDHVAIFTSVMNSIRDVAQNVGRFRINENQSISFMKSNAKFQTSLEYIYCTEVVKGISEGKVKQNYEKLRNIPGADLVLNRISRKNEIARDYENNTLIALEILGHKINFGYVPAKCC